MNEPTEECVVDFWTNDTLKKLPVSSSNPRFLKAAAFLRDSCTDKDVCRKNLADDFFRLFAESGLPMALPCSSTYLKNDNYAGKALDEVSEFYKSYGWESKLNGKVPDDHLGIELLFLTRLVDRYLMMDDDPCCCEMQKEIHRFIEQHIMTWIPAWNEDIQEHAHTLSYKGIGILIYACMEDLSSIFSYRDNPL